ncbi:MAG: hypothetical protein OES25_11520 [Acidobacteriota bacterium]|nr:hypothetical protein [Acidobacteriota bacterium]
MISIERKLSVSDFNGQFLLSQDEKIICDKWHVQDLNGWALSHHDSLRLIEVTSNDATGDCIGWFLGWPINSSGELIYESTIAPFTKAGIARTDQLETFLYCHGGRWIFISGTAELPRIYLDPCGSLALVYALSGRQIASTTTLMSSDAKFGHRWLETGVEEFPGTNQFFPLGLTGDKKIARLMPNHYLDLRTNKPVRHWPLNDIPRVNTAKETAELIDTIVSHVKNNLKALAGDAQLYLSLTAGRDSRMLLACSKEIRDRISCFTFSDQLGTGPIDLELAKHICQHVDLPHETVPLASVGTALRDEYLRRIGYAGNAGKAADFLQAAGKYLDPSKIWLIGYAGEVGRSFYWLKNDTKDTKIDPANLLQRMNLPSTPQFIEPMKAWITDLDSLDFYGLLDMMYLELRMGTWAAPHLYGCAPIRGVIVPLCHRGIMEAMLKLPVEYRWQQNLANDVIRTAWPELLQIPFQRMPGAYGLWLYVKDNKIAPRINRYIDLLGTLRGRSRTYDTLYNTARSIYRGIRKQ